MKTILTILVLLSINHVINGQCTYHGNDVLLDSVIKHHDLEIKVYTSSLSKHSYFRFYNSSGFFCYEIEKNESNEIIRLKNGDIKKNFIYDYDIERDPIFTSDTFYIGFANHVYQAAGNSIITKMNNALDYYYTPHNCNEFYFEEFANNSLLADTSNLDEEIFIIISSAPVEITPKWYDEFKQIVLNDVRFNFVERLRQNKSLVFSIIGNEKGQVLEVKLLSKIKSKKQSLIDYNIKNSDFPRLRPRKSRGGSRKFKATIVVEI